MFDNLSNRLKQTFKNIRGQGRLTEANIEEAIREVRRALLEADVAFLVVKAFIDQVKTRALGEEVATSLTPGQAFIKIVQDELTQVMGQHNESLNLSAEPPAVILMAGLQGAGKTTTVAKLAKFLVEREKKKPLVVSTDVVRPAAIEQLKTLSDQIQVDCFPSQASEQPKDIAAKALNHAKRQFYDVLIVDTAGRTHVNEDMMVQIQQLHQQLNPVETLFVVDAMTGQDAATSAKAFHDALPLTGVVLTKADGDARGGSALSIRHITGKPIKFLGVGEKIDGLEAFHPDRMASRILDMGDVLSLIEAAEQKVDRAEAEKLAKKLKKGKGFDLEDFLGQLQQIKNLGGIGSIMSKMPGMGAMAGQMPDDAGQAQFQQMEAIIQSMTPLERQKPDIIKGSRKRRIALGSGTQVQDVNRVLKQFMQMQKMMKKVSGKGMKGMMRQMGGRLPPGGGLPGGGFPFK